MIRAALLHDVGKRHSRLGVIGRSIVTGLAKIGLGRLVARPGSRADLYLRHGELAAAELASLEPEAIVAAFARSHHGDRPEGITQEDWEVLIGADR